MSLYDRKYFAGRFTAQEAAKASGEVVNTDRMPGAGVEVQLDLLPMPPTVNEAWHHVATERHDVNTVLTAEHRAFRSTVMGIVHGHKRAHNWLMLLGRLEVNVKLCYRDRRKTDVDNRVKPLLDALQAAGAFKDDSQIDVLNVRRVIIPGGEECCRVTITEIT